MMVFMLIKKILLLGCLVSLSVVAMEDIISENPSKLHSSIIQNPVEMPLKEGIPTEVKDATFVSTKEKKERIVIMEKNPLTKNNVKESDEKKPIYGKNMVKRDIPYKKNSSVFPSGEWSAQLQQLKLSQSNTEKEKKSSYK
jgi:hypothetical protein